MTEIQVPFSIDAERAVIGSVLIDPQLITRIQVDAHDFYSGRHAMIWQVILHQVQTGQAVDTVTVSDELEKTGRMKEIGGASYLTQLLIDTPTSLHADDYARIIRERSRRRKIIQIAGDIANAAYDLDSKLDSVIANSTTKLAMSYIPEEGARPISEFVSDFYDDISERVANPQDIYGIPTGFIDYDKLTQGLQPGEMTIISGDPGLGKSLLVAQMACGMAKHSPGAFYELEMRGNNIIRREVSGRTKIPTSAMMSGKITDDNWTELVRAIDEMSKLPIYMSDASNWNTTSLRADLSRLKENYGIEWFCVDYLDLLTDDYGKDGNERSAYISRQAHAICKDLKLGGIFIHSMNKAGIGQDTPGKKNLSGSAKLAYDADQIVFMAKSQNNPNTIVLTWEKVREGDGNRVMRLVKTTGYPSFQNYAAEGK
jgi:replicative DNA helicase